MRPKSYLIVLLTVLVSGNVNAQCQKATEPSIVYTVDTISACTSATIQAKIDTGSLRSDSVWAWYSGICGSTFIGYGDSITIPLGYLDKSIFARGQGSCTGTAPCGDTVVIGLDQPPIPNAHPLPPKRGQCQAGYYSSLTWPQGWDDCDGMVWGSPNVGVPALYSQGVDSVFWTYTDSRWQTYTHKQLLIVKDTIAPVPNTASLPVIRTQCDTIIKEFPSSIDNCAGFTSGPNGGPGPGPLDAYTTDTLFNTQGTFLITWTYDDTRGNITTQVQPIEVKDTIGPDLTCPNDTSVKTITNSIPIFNLGAIVSDACVGVQSLSYSLLGSTTGSGPTDASGVSYNVGQTKLIYESIDYNWNVSTCTTNVGVTKGIGIEENELSPFKIYPNPTSDFLQVTITESKGDDYRYVLLNEAGQEVQTGEINKKNSGIYLECEPGVYFFEIYFDQKKLGVHRIIKI